VNAISLLVVILIFSTQLGGCESAARLATKKAANWAYVDKAWGGLAIENVNYARDTATIKFKTGLYTPTQLDSAICACGGSAKSEGHSILVRLDQCSCGSGWSSSTVQFRRPTPGTYAVVYDDETASRPEIGRLTVPE